MKYIPRILPLTLAEVEAEIDRHLYEEYAFGRPFIGQVRWDLEATRKVRLAEAQGEKP